MNLSKILIKFEKNLIKENLFNGKFITSLIVHRITLLVWNPKYKPLIKRIIIE
jgi:hypothetical protein